MFKFLWKSYAYRRAITVVFLALSSFRGSGFQRYGKNIISALSFWSWVPARLGLAQNPNIEILELIDQSCKEDFGLQNNFSGIKNFLAINATY